MKRFCLSLMLLLATTIFWVPTSAAQSPWAPLFTQFPGYYYGTCAVTTVISVACPSGTIYNGGHSVTVTGATVNLTANKTDCSAPSFGSCNFIIANSSGTVSTTATLATASASGNTVLALAETNAGGTAVTTLIPGWASGTPFSSAMLGNAPSTSQTLTTPVVTGGLTASGSGANDFSGSTGTFKPSTGTFTFQAAAVAATAGANNFDLSASSGTFKTPTGVSTFGGSSNAFTNAVSIAPVSAQIVLGTTNLTTLSALSPAGSATVAIGTTTGTLAPTYSCGTTVTCAAAAATANVKEVFGSAALSSASPSTASITALPFTSNTSYWCTATPEGTTAAVAAGGVAINKTSGSAMTLTGPNTVTTVIDYHCSGT